MIHVIAANRTWYRDLPRQLEHLAGHEFIWIDRKQDLGLERLQEIQPRYVFFPHWSSYIPEEIHQAFECVIFHMTDLPFGRGGSPLQNLIARGIYQTVVTALRCGSEVDAGPIYLKRELSLYGTAEEIYLRAAHVIGDMITHILTHSPVPVEQSGEVVCFERRKPEDGNLTALSELGQVFDFIRMLDAEGYPPAFLETEHLRLEFTRASRKQDSVLADVRITRKPS